MAQNTLGEPPTRAAARSSNTDVVRDVQAGDEQEEHFSARVPPDVKRRYLLMKVSTGKNLRDLCIEGLELLEQKHGKS